MQKKKLLQRLFEALILKPDGMGVRYRRTALDESSGRSPQIKKAACSSQAAHDSNLVVLDSRFDRSASRALGGQEVVGSSIDRVGRSGGIRTHDPQLPKLMR